MSSTQQTSILPLDMASIFHRQQNFKKGIAQSTTKQRKAKLRKLLHAVEVTYRNEIRQALLEDFGKSAAEVDLTEIYPVTGEIKYALRNLGDWMLDKPVNTKLAFFGSSSKIKYEPKGNVLIISPWNFPINLSFCPLISAIAAGNTVILKPSEHTERTSALMKKMINELFDEQEIAVIEGGINESTALLKLPFNHIFFTGAPEIGKIVMRAAAVHLASVTLELGGKSPTVVDETADIETAAKRIIWGKFLNAGQICIAPDYVNVHRSKVDEFIVAAKQTLEKFFGLNSSDSKDYTKIVNIKHFNRLMDYLKNAVDKGAEIVHGGESDADTRSLAPTLMKDVPMDSDLMQQEIFGPILPIRVYDHIDEVLEVINDKEKPLALYIYSKSQKNIRYILNNTNSGGVCINSNDLHFFNHELPFGGVNNSGIGSSHGKHGFMAFSNERSIYRQHIPGAIELLMPPYNNFKQTLINLTIKWF
jgi:aldehyde dehydrogenase (NAD+)|tara:strand:- start:7927 stop:9354 length:1428 start_codon:yes stop_codon:yes gene_type:complete